MKRLLTYMAVALMLSGCVIYPGYDYGYYGAGYYPYAYGYAAPRVDFFVTNIHSSHFSHHGFHHGFRGGGFRGGFRR
jgi:hypothetical protein